MAKELFNQALKTLLGLTDRISSAIPGQTGADNILYPDLREQIGDEIISSAPEKTSLVGADEIGVSDSEDSEILKAITWLNLRKILTQYKDVVFNAAINFDFDNYVAGFQNMPLSGNVIPSISNELPGGTYIVTFSTDLTGGYSIAPNSTFGTKTDNSIDDVASASASAIYIYTIIVKPDGSKLYTVESQGN